MNTNHYLDAVARAFRNALKRTLGNRYNPTTAAAIVADALAQLHAPAPWAPPLDVAEAVAHRTLTEADTVDIHNHHAVIASHASLAIALRQVLDALNADDRPAGLRCPAAHRDDPTPCCGPVVVTVVDQHCDGPHADTVLDDTGTPGCEHHAARLLASLENARVYPLPGTPDTAAAIRVHQAAHHTRPFAWINDAPRTRPDQLSHAETRQQGGTQ